jgi:hypothetical protein
MVNYFLIGIVGWVDNIKMAAQLAASQEGLISVSK